jgi:outer membrane protein assembly factor BamD
MPRGLRPLLLGACLALAATAGCSAMKKPSSTGLSVVSTGREPTEIYDHGLSMLKKGLYEKAEQDFQELRNYHRDDPLSVKAQLALADLHFQRAEYEEARYGYEEFATYHPRHEDMDYVTWRIGMCIWKRAPRIAGRDQATTRQVVSTWTGFERRFPESEHKEEVVKVLAKAVDRLAMKELWVARFYEKRGAWAAVRGRATALLRRYPDSTHAEEALGLLALAHQEVGAPEDATAARARLAERFPESAWIARVDHRLALPPGSPPEAEIFVRPYRMSGMSMGAAPGR